MLSQYTISNRHLEKDNVYIPSGKILHDKFEVEFTVSNYTPSLIYTSFVYSLLDLSL